MISCANHDFVEIACMYHFEVKLVLKSGKIVRGKAFQTAYNENKEECLVLEPDTDNESVVLEQVALMEAVTRNPHFDKVEIK